MRSVGGKHSSVLGLVFVVLTLMVALVTPVSAQTDEQSEAEDIVVETTVPGTTVPIEDSSTTVPDSGPPTTVDSTTTTSDPAGPDGGAVARLEEEDEEPSPAGLQDDFDPFDTPVIEHPVPASVAAPAGREPEVLPTQPVIDIGEAIKEGLPERPASTVKALPVVSADTATDKLSNTFVGTPFGLRVPAQDTESEGSKGQAQLRTLPADQATQLSIIGTAFTLSISGHGGRPSGLPALDVAEGPDGKAPVGGTDRAELGRESGWELTVDRTLLPEGLTAEQTDRLSVFVHSDCDAVMQCRIVEQLPTRIDQSNGLLVATLGNEVLQAVGGPNRVKPVGGAISIAGVAFRGVIPNVYGFAYQSSSNVFFSVSTAGSGGQNDYSANQYSSLATWQVGVRTGHAESAYSVPMPPTVGPTPDVSFSYSSGAVDGMTPNKNNQGGIVGIGWSTSQPVISRATRVCASTSSNQTGGTGIDADGWWESNLCFAYPDDPTRGFVLTMDGVGGRLVPTGASGITHPTVTGATYQRFVTESMSDLRILLVTKTSIVGSSTSNGGTYGQWWEVTTADGALYVFGRDFIFKPSSTTTAPLAAGRVVDTTRRTNSTQVAPVAKTGQYSCGGNLQLCDTVINWHLDQVVDANGNMATYQYWRDANYYRQTAYSGTASYHLYDRSVNPTYIDYGLTYGNAVPAPGGAGMRLRVAFEYSYRTPNGSMYSSGSNYHPMSAWVDTPTDLLCNSSGVSWDGGSCAGIKTPSFFSIIKLTAVKTYVGGTRVSSDVLGQLYMDPGTNDGSAVKLWLDTIQHRGTTDSIVMPHVNLDHVWLANRVNHPTGVSSATMPRLSRLRTEFGGQVTFTYGQPGHTPSQSLPTTDGCYSGANDPNGYIRTGCYMFIQQYSNSTSSGAVLFNKWVVTKVREDAGLNSHSDYTESTFTYVSEPDWAYNEQWGFMATDYNPAVSAGFRHCQYGYGCNYWSDYRGHREVIVKDRDGNQVKHFFFTGMRDDRTSPSNISPLYSGEPSHPANNVSTPNGSSRWNRKTRLGLSPGTQTLLPGGQMTSYDDYLYSRTWVVNQSTSWPGSIRNKWVENETEIRDPNISGYLQRTLTRQYFDGTMRMYRVQDYGLTASSTISPLPTDETTTCMAYPTVNTAALNGSWIVGIAWKTATVNSVYTSCTATAGFPHRATWISGVTSLFDGSVAGSLPSRGNTTDVRTFQHRGLAYPNQPGFNYTHNSKGQVLTVTERHTNALTTNTYDTWGHVSSTDGPLTGTGDKTSFVVDKRWGVQTQITARNSQANGNANLVTTLTYDGLGRLKTVRLPGATKDSYLFDYIVSNDFNTASFTKTRILREAGATTGENIITYDVMDGFGRSVQTQTRNPDNSTVTVTSQFYGDVGQVKQANNPVAVTTTAYGALLSATPSKGYTTTSINPQTQRVTTYLKNSAGSTHVSSWVQTRGLVTTSNDPLNHQTVATTDIRGNTVKVTDPAGTTNFVFNVRSQVTSIDGPGAGDTITYSYGSQWDVALKQIIDPDLGTISYGYRWYGLLKTQVDGRGNSTYIERDVAGRPTAFRVGSASGALISEWDYDNTGRLVGSDHYNRLQSGVSNGQVSETFGYDARGRANTTTWTIPGLAGTPTISTVLRESGGVESINYPGVNDTAVFEFDSLERHDALTFNNVTLGSGPVFNARSQLVSFDIGDQAQTGSAFGTTTLLYEAWSGRVQAAKTVSGSTNLSELAYAWDGAGNVIRFRDRSGGGQQYHCFSYDSSDRLKTGYTTSGDCTTGTHDTGPDPYDVSYTYTANGNIASAAGTETLNASYVYGAGSAGPHAVTSAGSGNSFTYDDAGNQVGRTISGQTQVLAYDALNRLVKITGSGADMDVLYDASGNRVKRVLDSTTTFFLGDSYQSETTGSTTQTQVHHSFNGVSVGSTVDGVFLLSVADHVGSGVANLDSAGVITRQGYTPFGMIRGGGSNGLATDRTFTGQTDDPGTGLIDYNARAYDPLLGRFVMGDTVLDGLNRYSYVRNNPVRYTDPTGHCVMGLPCLADEIFDAAVGAGGAVNDANSAAGGAVLDAAGAVNDANSTAGGAALDAGGVAIDVHNALGNAALDATVDEVVRLASNSGNYSVHLYDSSVRRANSPIQTAFDMGTGTVIVEELAAGQAILVQGGRVERSGPYCGEVATCITGVWTPKSAITLGHTVLFSATELDPSLVAHEIQHVFDIETVGGLGFYGTYGLAWAFQKANGLGDGYHDIYWERRAYEIKNNYGSGARPSKSGLLTGSNPSWGSNVSSASGPR